MLWLSSGNRQTDTHTQSHTGKYRNTLAHAHWGLIKCKFGEYWYRSGDLFGSMGIQFIPYVTLFMEAALTWWTEKWKPKWANCAPKWVNWTFCQLTLLKLRVVQVKATLQQCLAYCTPCLLLNNISLSFFIRDTFNTVLDTCLGCLAVDRSPKEIHGRLKCREVLHLWMYSHEMQYQRHCLEYEWFGQATGT